MLGSDRLSSFFEGLRLGFGIAGAAVDEVDEVDCSAAAAAVVVVGGIVDVADGALLLLLLLLLLALPLSLDVFGVVVCDGL